MAVGVEADTGVSPGNRRARPEGLPVADATGADVAGLPVVRREPQREVPNAAVASIAYISTHGAVIQWHGSWQIARLPGKDTTRGRSEAALKKTGCCPRYSYMPDFLMKSTMHLSEFTLKSRRIRTLARCEAQMQQGFDKRQSRTRRRAKIDGAASRKKIKSTQARTKNCRNASRQPHENVGRTCKATSRAAARWRQSTCRWLGLALPPFGA